MSKGGKMKLSKIKLQRLTEKVDDLNKRLLENNFYGVEPDGTWASTYVFKPIRISAAAGIIINYREAFSFSKKAYRDYYSQKNPDLNWALNWISRCIKKAKKSDLCKA